MKAASAWDYAAQAESPDGQYVAVFDHACEICMGGPVAGVLIVIEKQTGREIARIKGANGAFVWSALSDAVAFPQWNAERNQNLAILWLPTGNVEVCEESFRVLELEQFDHGKIEGIDSPIHDARRVSITVRKNA